MFHKPFRNMSHLGAIFIIYEDCCSGYLKNTIFDTSLGNPSDSLSYLNYLIHLFPHDWCLSHRNSKFYYENFPYHPNQKLFVYFYFVFHLIIVAKPKLIRSMLS